MGEGGTRPQPNSDVYIRRADLINQWRKVLRLRESSEIVLFDGSGFEYGARIISMNGDEVVVKTLEARHVPSPRHKLMLFQSLLKKDKFEWVLQKCTEIGVSGFVPIISERSEKKGLNLERARKIVIEASEQSGRGDVPNIAEPVALSAALEGVQGSAVAFDPNGDALKEGTLRRLMPEVVFIGPEGGWSEPELTQFREHGFEVLSLGPRILRAETAAVAVSALSLLGD